MFIRIVCEETKKEFIINRDHIQYLEQFSETRGGYVKVLGRQAKIPVDNTSYHTIRRSITGAHLLSGEVI